jgi:hypothetical protein
VTTATPPPPIVSFAQLPHGWRAFQGPQGSAFATSWPYRQDSHGPAGSLPPNGIIVQVFFPPGAKTPYRPLKLVIPKRPAALLEGTTDTPEYRIHGRVRGRNVEVWVDIRNRHPTKAALRLAQRVVTAIRFR